jgi:hypothetical protein
LLLILAGLYPLARAWRANRRTSLAHAVCWAALAWLAWGAALLFGSPYDFGLDPWRYVALCLTGAAGVAVLGARRPHVEAWDVVVLGLLAVMLLPLAENLFLHTPPLDGLRIVFLTATLAIGIVNYVPTAVSIAAVLLGGILLGECLALFATDLKIGPRTLAILHVSLLILPWLALGIWGRRRAETLVINRLWRDFRDRCGLFWGQRVRDQYNRAVAHAGLPGFLFWHGWELGDKELPPTAEQTREMQVTLLALIKRFVDQPEAQAKQSQ